jgi:hypothetical protein
MRQTIIFFLFSLVIFANNEFCLSKKIDMNESVFNKYLTKVSNNILPRPNSMLKITKSSDWNQTATMPPGHQWYYHQLGLSLGPLLNKKYKNSTSKALVKKHILLWNEWSKNKNKYSYVEQAWGHHATALRLEFLTCVYSNYEEKDWILPIIQEHIEFVADPKNYDGNWNHGLDQNIALLASSCLLGLDEYKTLAYNRIKENFSHSFDSDGVNFEQSVGYHHYNMQRYRDASDIIEECGLDNSFINETLNKSKIFLLYALLPNGKYTPIGDTSYKIPSLTISSHEINYLKTKGLTGKLPDLPLETVFGEGYVFGRSSWDVTQNPSFYSIRFGKARKFHGHNDHTSFTYYADEKPIIIDGGFDGYNNKFFRKYFRSPEAHNVVTTTDNANFFWNSETTLTSTDTPQGNMKNTKTYLLQDTPYYKTKRTRKFFVDIKHDNIVITDMIDGYKAREYTNRFHFNKDIPLTISSDNTLLLNTGKDIITVKTIIDDNSSIEIIRGRKNEKVQYTAGFSGLGNDKLYKTSTLIVRKRGKKVTFVTIISKNNFTVNTKEKIISFELYDYHYGIK